MTQHCPLRAKLDSAASRILAPKLAVSWSIYSSTDQTGAPLLLYTYGGGSRWPAGWRSSGWHPALSCQSCQPEPGTGCGRTGAEYCKCPPVGRSQRPGGHRRTCESPLQPWVCAGCTSVLHLCPLFRQQALQGPDEQKAEAAFFCSLHLSVGHKKRNQLSGSAGAFGP